MEDAEQSFVQNNEEQNFPIQESDNNLVINEIDQQNIAGIVPEEYTFAVNESENQSFSVNEQSFAGNELENNFRVIAEQNYTENENEHALEGEIAVNGLDENQLKQEFTDIEVNGTGSAPDDLNLDKKDGHENNLAGGGEKKWPGWPGESVFRMLVPAQKVGNIIGRKGEYIKKTVEETRARIKILDGPPGSRERAVLLAIFKATNQSPMPFLI